MKEKNRKSRTASTNAHVQPIEMNRIIEKISNEIVKVNENLQKIIEQQNS